MGVWRAVSRPRPVSATAMYLNPCRSTSFHAEPSVTLAWRVSEPVGYQQGPELTGKLHRRIAAGWT